MHHRLTADQTLSQPTVIFQTPLISHCTLALRSRDFRIAFYECSVFFDPCSTFVAELADFIRELQPALKWGYNTRAYDSTLTPLES
jgi:hypothetical protein